MKEKRISKILIPLTAIVIIAVLTVLAWVFIRFMGTSHRADGKNKSIQSETVVVTDEPKIEKTEALLEEIKVIGEEAKEEAERNVETLKKVQELIDLGEHEEAMRLMQEMNEEMETKHNITDER